MVYDQSPIGTRHLKYLEDEGRIIGLEIARAEPISPLCEDAAAEVAKVLECKPEGFVYLGLGLSAPAVAHPLAASGWQGPRIMNTAGLRGYHGDFAAAIDGWIYVDMHSDGNRTLTALMAQMGIAKEQAVWAAVRHDFGRLVAEGLARATELTREGVKTGLEQVKWLPAAEGMEGTTLGLRHPGPRRAARALSGAAAVGERAERGSGSAKLTFPAGTRKGDCEQEPP